MYNIADLLKSLKHIDPKTQQILIEEATNTKAKIAALKSKKTYKIDKPNGFDIILESDPSYEIQALNDKFMSLLEKYLTKHIIHETAPQEEQILPDQINNYIDLLKSNGLLLNKIKEKEELIANLLIQISEGKTELISQKNEWMKIVEQMKATHQKQLSDTIDEFNNTIDRHLKRITNLQKSGITKDTEIQRLLIDVQTKKNQIQQLQQSQSADNSTLQRLRSEIQIKEDQIQQLQQSQSSDYSTLQNQASRITELLQQLKNCEDQKETIDKLQSEYKIFIEKVKTEFSDVELKTLDDLLDFIHQINEGSKNPLKVEQVDLLDKQLSSQIENLQAENERLKADLDTYKSELESKQANPQLLIEIRKLEGKNAKLQESLNQQLQENPSESYIRKQNTELQKTLAKCRGENKDLESTIQEERVKCLNDKNKLQSELDKLKKFIGERKTLYRDIQTLQIQIENSGYTQSLRDSITKFINQLHDEFKNKTFEQRENQIGKSEEPEKSFLQVIHQAKYILEYVNRKSVRVFDTADLNYQINEFKNAIDNYKKNIKNYQDVADKLVECQEENKTYQKRNEEAKNKYQDIKNQLIQVKSDNVLLNQELELAHKKYEEEEKSNSELLTNGKTYIDKLRSELDEIKTELESREVDHSDLMLIIQKLDQNHEYIKNTISELNKEGIKLPEDIIQNLINALTDYDPKQVHLQEKENELIESLKNLISSNIIRSRLGGAEIPNQSEIRSSPLFAGLAGLLWFGAYALLIFLLILIIFYLVYDIYQLKYNNDYII